MPSLEDSNELSPRRTTIAKKRIGAPIAWGGLDIKPCKTIAHRIYSKSFLTFLQWLQGRDRIYSHLLPPSIFIHLGSSRMTSVHRLMDQISKPTIGVKDHFRATLKSFELDESYVLDIPLSSSAHSSVSPSDHMIQTIPFPRTLRSVLDSSPMGLLLPCLQARHRHSPGLTRTLTSLINKIQLRYPDIFPPNDPLLFTP